AVVLVLLGDLVQVVVDHIGDRPVRAGVLGRLDALLAGHQPVAPVVGVVRLPGGGRPAGEPHLAGQVAVADTSLVVLVGQDRGEVARVGADGGAGDPAQPVVAGLGEGAGRAGHPVRPAPIVVVGEGGVVVHPGRARVQPGPVAHPVEVEVVV